MNIILNRSKKRSAVLAVLSGGLMNLALCSGNENFREFRETAGPGIEAGLQTILIEGDDGAAFDDIIDSILAGLFEIVEPDGTNGRP
jgi:hypothetical protein